MARIWTKELNVDILNARGKNTMMEFIGIEMLEVGDDFVKARMPVDHRTKQPIGILHGGASCVLAEGLSSAAGNFCVQNEKDYCVGLEINANHIRSVREGFVIGRATPKHIGKTTQVWEITVSTEEGKLVCVSRLTVQVLDIAR